MKRRPTKPLQPYRNQLKVVLRACPHCGDEPPAGIVIYRMSPRSVTMRCKNCSLQWTMTMHQISKMAAAYAERCEEGSFSRWLHEDTALMFDVPEKRGRR